MLRSLLNALLRRKPIEEATYPDRHKFIEAVAIRLEPEVVFPDDEVDDWADAVQYEQDVDRIHELIAVRAELRRLHKTATHVDPEIAQIRQRMLEFEVRRK